MGDGKVRNIALIFNTQSDYSGRMDEYSWKVAKMAKEKYRKEGYKCYEIHDGYNTFKPTVEGVEKLIEGLKRSNIDDDDNLVIFTTGSGWEDMFVDCGPYERTEYLGSGRWATDELKVCEENRKYINRELFYRLSALPHGKISMITVNPESAGWGSHFVKDPAALWINQSAKYNTWLAVKEDGLKLGDAKPAQRRDHDSAMAAVEQNCLALQYVDPSVEGYREIVITAATQKEVEPRKLFNLDHKIWGFIDSSLWKDREFVVSLARIDGRILSEDKFLEFIDPSLWKDREFVMSLAGIDGGILSRADESIRKDPKSVFQAARYGLGALASADPSLLKNFDFMLSVMKVHRNARALTYAHPTLKKNPKSIFMFMEHYPDAWKYADASLWKNRKFAGAMAKQHYAALPLVDSSLWKERSFVLDVVSWNAYAWGYADETMQNSPKFALAAIRKNADVWAYIGASLRYNDKFMRAAKKYLRKTDCSCD